VGGWAVCRRLNIADDPTCTPNREGAVIRRDGAYRAARARQEASFRLVGGNHEERYVGRLAAYGDFEQLHGNRSMG